MFVLLRTLALLGMFPVADKFSNCSSLIDAVSVFRGLDPISQAGIVVLVFGSCFVVGEMVYASVTYLWRITFDKDARGDNHGSKAEPTYDKPKPPTNIRNRGHRSARVRHGKKSGSKRNVAKKRAA